MSEYFLLEADNYNDYGVTENPKIDDDSSFLGGSLITKQLPALVFEINFPKKENPPHFFGDEIPLVSKAFLEALKKCGIDNFQSFPAKLINPDTGQSWEDYLAFNVVGLVKAADMEKSDFDTLMEGDDDGIEVPLVAFRDVVLEKAKTNGMDMFRMAESPVALVISEKIVDFLSANKPKGGWGLDAIEIETV
jgi:hypothetical protein